MTILNRHKKHYRKMEKKYNNDSDNGLSIHNFLRQLLQ